MTNNVKEVEQLSFIIIRLTTSVQKRLNRLDVITNNRRYGGIVKNKNNTKSLRSNDRQTYRQTG